MRIFSESAFAFGILASPLTFQVQDTCALPKDFAARFVNGSFPDPAIATTIEYHGTHCEVVKGGDYEQCLGLASAPTPAEVLRLAGKLGTVPVQKRPKPSVATVDLQAPSSPTYALPLLEPPFLSRQEVETDFVVDPLIWNNGILLVGCNPPEAIDTVGEGAPRRPTRRRDQNVTYPDDGVRRGQPESVLLRRPNPRKASARQINLRARRLTRTSFREPFAERPIPPRIRRNE